MDSTNSEHQTPRSIYEMHLKRDDFSHDPAQQNAIENLQRLYDEVQSYANQRKPSLLGKIFGKKNAAPPRGLYMWGGVGRGKSFLMDSFFSCVPQQGKRRLHFHHFMQEVHKMMEEVKGEADPLSMVAKKIYDRNWILCFDEFHVSDIADAMILVRLLDVLFKMGMVFVMTSNYKPDDLYPNGLQRINFLPAIGLLNQHLDVINVDGGTDYRLRTLEKIEIYHCPLDAQAEKNLDKAYLDLRQGEEDLDSRLEIENRIVQAKRVTSGMVWFDFKELCGGPRSQADYLSIAQEYHTVLISNIPKMDAQTASEARRFTWMVDVFYDHRVKLIVSAEVPPEELYLSGPHSGEFFRTVSRLQEMQSKVYLSEAHIVAE